MRCTEDILKLPPSWSKLENLEVLDFRKSDGVIILDKVILKMKKLRHIYAKIWRSEVGLGNLRNLETLSKLRLTDSALWQLKELTGSSKLSKLCFVMDEIRDIDKLCTYLCKLENLESLTINYHDSSHLTGLANLRRLTQLKLVFLEPLDDIRQLREFPPNLSYLTLSVPRMPKNSMLVLEKLPKLIHLKATATEFRKEKVAVSLEGFPLLKVLHLVIRKVPVVEIGEGAMPELNKFIIEECRYLNVENLPNHFKSAITYADYLYK